MSLNRTASSELYERARRVMPGGVSSPVRAFKSVGGTPIAFRRGEGALLTDADGNSYTDFVASWGPLILGHAHPKVMDAVRDQLARGTTYGAPHTTEIELAERIVGMYPGADQVRFVSSGTEAVMSAVRLARGVTGRDVIIKFAGCYHGHADHLLVDAGSGLVTFGVPSSAGVPDAFSSLTSVLQLDDEGGIDKAFAEFGDKIAAVIIEPVPANNGLLVQRREFLEHLRAVTKTHGALLIFDEVINGFRLAPGGAAEMYGITPDLGTFGKVIGGGLPVGAFAGSRAIMEHLAPLGPVYQAGTLSGNPVAMAAGLATLNVLEAEDGWAKLEQLGKALDSRMEQVRAASAVPFGYRRVGSLFWLCLQDGDPPRRPQDIAAESADRYRHVFTHLLNEGVYFAPSAYEVGFLSLSHTEADLDKLSAALKGALSKPIEVVN